MSIRKLNVQWSFLLFHNLVGKGSHTYNTPAAKSYGIKLKKKHLTQNVILCSQIKLSEQIYRSCENRRQAERHTPRIPSTQTARVMKQPVHQIQSAIAASHMK
ncbi:hypothetical protein XENOCAPTIV_013339 [Xenoophorus captivus]|uniref:Secreted protein n=1 Tax=Xenoophorus captivus TaxID=1517983 RepID=A0ABV0RR06_9TELE